MQPSLGQVAERSKSSIKTSDWEDRGSNLGEGTYF